MEQNNIEIIVRFLDGTDGSKQTGYADVSTATRAAFAIAQELSLPGTPQPASVSIMQDDILVISIYTKPGVPLLR